MPKNYGVVDLKPTTTALDQKPRNRLVLDIKPTMGLQVGELPTVYERVLVAGQPMGLLLALTYPTTGTVLSDQQSF